MGNHFHLLAQMPDPRRLFRMMAGLLRSLTALIPTAIEAA